MRSLLRHTFSLSYWQSKLHLWLVYSLLWLSVFAFSGYIQPVATPYFQQSEITLLHAEYYSGATINWNPNHNAPPPSNIVIPTLTLLAWGLAIQLLVIQKLKQYAQSHRPSFLTFSPFREMGLSSDEAASYLH